MYRYIFFDLDGTLTDSKEGVINSVRWTLQRMGAPAPEETTLLRFIGPPLQDSFQRFCGFSPERAAEAVTLFRERYLPVGQFENQAAPGAADLLARLGLDLSDGRPVRDYSGGMKRRLSLARALLVPSGALALDEPFSGLDGETHARCLACVREAAAEKPVLLATHDPADAEGFPILRL